MELRLAREASPATCSAGEKRFCDILQTADEHHIRAGYVRDRLENIPDEAKTLIRKRDRLRILSLTHPHISQLNIQNADHITTSNRDKWRTVVESCNRTHDPGLIWKLIDTMTGKKKTESPHTNQ